MKHNKEARHWFDLSHVWFKKAVSLSWQKNACSAAFYLDWFQRKGLIIWDQSVHPYVNDMRSINASICKWYESICEGTSALESCGVLGSLSHQRMPQHVLHLAYILFPCHAVSDVADWCDLMETVIPRDKRCWSEKWMLATL